MATCRPATATTSGDCSKSGRKGVGFIIDTDGNPTEEKGNAKKLRCLLSPFTAISEVGKCDKQWFLAIMNEKEGSINSFQVTFGL